MTGYALLVIRWTFCCDLAVESNCQRHSYECPVPPHQHRMWHRRNMPPPSDDIGQGEGCEGGKCAIRQ